MFGPAALDDAPEPMLDRDHFGRTEPDFEFNRRVVVGAVARGPGRATLVSLPRVRREHRLPTLRNTDFLR